MKKQIDQIMECLRAAHEHCEEGDAYMAGMHVAEALPWARWLAEDISAADERRVARNMARRQRAADKRLFAAMEVN